MDNDYNYDDAYGDDYNHDDVYDGDYNDDDYNNMLLLIMIAQHINISDIWAGLGMNYL